MVSNKLDFDKNSSNQYQDLKKFHELTQKFLPDKIVSSGSKSIFDQPLLELFCVVFIKYLCDQREGVDTPSSETFHLNIPKEPMWNDIREDNSTEKLQKWVNKLEEHPDNNSIKGVFSTILFTFNSNNLVSLIKQQDITQSVSSIDQITVNKNDLVMWFDHVLKSLFEFSRFDIGYSTPLDLILLLSKLLDPPENSTIYDPACGIGNLLLNVHKLIASNDEKPGYFQLYGQEIDPYIATVARLNLLIHEVYTGIIKKGDTLIQPQFLDNSGIQKFDFIVCNPPLGTKLSKDYIDKIRSDKFNRFSSLSQRPNEELLFIQHIATSMSDVGKAIILGTSRIFLENIGNETRKYLVDEDLVDVVISLPHGLFSSTSIPLSIIILSKKKSKEYRNKILFIYADEGYSQDGHTKYIDDSDRNRIVQAATEKEEHRRFSQLITNKEISENNFILTPTFYIDIVGLETFLGGQVNLELISNLGEIYFGSKFRETKKTSSNTRIIRARDLSAPRINIEDLSTARQPEGKQRLIFAEPGDILIQRISPQPRAYLADEDLDGILIGGDVLILRLHEENREIAPYIVDFLNSDIGQALLLTRISSSGILPPSTKHLRTLKIPIPDKSVLSLLSNIGDAETNLLNKIEQARTIRQRLFNIDDPDKANTLLSSLSTEASVLSDILSEVNSTDFMLRNFYPLPIAYNYRAISAEKNPQQLYDAQLRFVEFMLIFLGNIGLVVAGENQHLASPDFSAITKTGLENMWSKGFSMGDWQSIAQNCGNLLHGYRQSAIEDQFSSLWYTTKNKKATTFTKSTLEFVQKRNEFAHHRGPRTEAEFELGNNDLSEKISDCLERISFFTQYRIRLVEDYDQDWQTKQFRIDTCLFIGDHPLGLRRERSSYPHPLTKGILYLEVTEKNWLPLYPFISIHSCPECNNTETYFLDKRVRSSQKTRMISFERSHILENEEAEKIGEDLDYWIDNQFPITNL